MISASPGGRVQSSNGTYHPSLEHGERKTRLQQSDVCGLMLKTPDRIEQRETDWVLFAMYTTSLLQNVEVTDVLTNNLLSLEDDALHFEQAGLKVWACCFKFRSVPGENWTNA